ncbi:MAG: dicarboxylate/amino acid:cation symporter [Holosporales bacterium]|jgi:proton glutamate symport protein|nr:dicarboxylate/amino acid:cation symporter [Holosporales bacterium]
MHVIKKNLANILLNSPLLLLICITGGIYVGFYHKELSSYLAPIASFYTNLLQITVIPIIAITLLTNMSKLLTHGGSNKYIIKIIAVFSFMLCFTGLCAVIVGAIIQPGEDMSNDEGIVCIVEDSGGVRTREVTLDDPIEKEQSVSIVDFLVNTVPNNIFNALSHANMLQIIIFCVMFGVACGIVSRKDKQPRLRELGSYLAVLHKINEKVLLFLPLGSFCLLGTQLSSVSDSTLGAIFKLALTMFLVIFVLSVVCSIVLWRCSSYKYLETLKALGNTLVMAFSTQSSIVCVPRAVKALTEGLNFDKQTVELTIPLGVPLCQFSTVCFYAIGTIFVVNIFNETISFSGYLFIVLASILTSFAASGVKGVVYYSLMAGILAPLGLPLGGVIALFIAVDPLIDPFGTVFHVYATCCSSAICCRLNGFGKRKKKQH